MLNYTIDSQQSKLLREQLRLFAFGDDVTTQASLDSLTGLSLRERLSALLEGELDFHGESTSYSSHDLHAFAAKFPPQLPRAFIRGLSEPGDIVLDPMMGSGTAIVESVIEGRNAIGFDLDPLALRLASAKTTPLEISEIRRFGQRVLTRANDLLLDQNGIEKALEKRFDEKTRSFINYWFQQKTQQELMALILAIEGIRDIRLRRFLELTFSSIIVTKSGGVSLARDLAHSRPHLDKTKVPKNAFDRFKRRLEKNITSLAKLRTNGIEPRIIPGDARAMPLDSCAVDLIVTSPPYANALDYMRAHKFSLVWFRESVTVLSELRARYIGSERVNGTAYTSLPHSTNRVVEQIEEKDKAKANILRKYFSEMRAVFLEMKRVLKDGCPAVLVVGPSVMRGIEVPTHLCLADIAVNVGFELVGIAKRNLERNKRMMPARFGKKGDSLIEQRMHEEYVIGILKTR